MRVRKRYLKSMATGKGGVKMALGLAGAKKQRTMKTRLRRYRMMKISLRLTLGFPVRRRAPSDQPVLPALSSTKTTALAGEPNPGALV